jgi:hypothetical protein
VTATDAAGNVSDPTPIAAIDGTVLPPTINASITDQANTVSGEGEAGATVTVTTGPNGTGETVGTAVVWTDGKWSFVTAPGTTVMDGATLYATQTDAAGNVSAEASRETFTDTDGDGTRNTVDTDDDNDGITDEIEGQFESEVITSATTVAATSTISGSPTTGYTSVVETNADGVVTIVATADGEAGSNGSGGGIGTRSSFTVQFDPVATETFEDAVLSIEIDRFDDGLFIEINGNTIVNFNANDWLFNASGQFRTGLGVNDKYDTNGDGLWSPFENPAEGNPVLRINTATGVVELLVDVNPAFGGGRANVLADIAAETGVRSGTPNPTPEPLPTLDWIAGVTVTTAFNNADGAGSIGQQRITVEGQFTGANDIDGDGIPNWLDIDTDNDRIWDKYELTTDSDNDGVADYRDLDSDNNGIQDGVQASLTAADITALESNGTSDRVDTGSYTNGSFSDQFILLTDTVDLDFTAIANTAFADVEYIDMADGANAQTVVLNGEEVIALTDTDNELIILGDGPGAVTDTVNAVGFVDTLKDQSIQGRTFSIYEADVSGTIARLIIEDGVSVTLT